MNYLAHLYLAEDTPESILGNFLGDFVKGSDFDCYSEGIKKGIQAHRKIDLFTDTHPLFIDSKRSIAPPNKRYAGIIIDIFYDYFLCKDWSAYSPIPLHKFTEKIYGILEDNEPILPDKLRKIIPRLKAENWLMSYTDIEGISTTLKRVSLRLKRHHTLETAVEDLREKSCQFEANFKLFFPELIQYANGLR